MSRFILLLEVLLWRAILAVKRFLDLHLSSHCPKPVSFTRRIRSSVGTVPGTFDLLFYTPRSYDASQVQNQHPTNPTKYPVIINFHGGGFTVGDACEDARWATIVAEETSAVVVSVNYRLAPRYPFPTPIDDCVSAIIWVWQHADEYNLDISRTALSGFSAGGSLTYTAAIRLHQELSRLKGIDSLCNMEVGTLKALVSFYPGTDWTHTREQRIASNPRLLESIPKCLYKTFDESYLYPPAELPDMSNELLSPGLASDELLVGALPDNMVLITCSGDQLLTESEIFRERLQNLGKRVDGYVVDSVPHAWDKMPALWKPTPKRDQAYKCAAQSLQEFFKLDRFY